MILNQKLKTYFWMVILLCQKSFFYISKMFKTTEMIFNLNCIKNPLLYGKLMAVPVWKWGKQSSLFLLSWIFNSPYHLQSCTDHMQGSEISFDITPWNSTGTHGRPNFSPSCGSSQSLKPSSPSHIRTQYLGKCATCNAQWPHKQKKQLQAIHKHHIFVSSREGNRIYRIEHLVNKDKTRYQYLLLLTSQIQISRHHCINIISNGQHNTSLS